MTSKEKREPLSHEEAHARRFHATVKTLAYDIYLGTLWWIDEELWKQKIGFGYAQRSTRKAHPGLSIRQSPVATPFERVPMLHGTSSRKGPVKACGLSRDNERVTYFGRIRPVRMGLGSFLRDIHKNVYKPELTDEEKAELVNWLRQKELLDER